MRIISNYSVNNRRQDRGKSRLHFNCICPFLWTAHRFSPIEPSRVRLASTLWIFNCFLSLDFTKDSRFCKAVNSCVDAIYYFLVRQIDLLRLEGFAKLFQYSTYPVSEYVPRSLEDKSLPPQASHLQISLQYKISSFSAVVLFLNGDRY